jgi:hypothetical protein
VSEDEPSVGLANGVARVQLFAEQERDDPAAEQQADREGIEGHSTSNRMAASK